MKTIVNWAKCLLEMCVYSALFLLAFGLMIYFFG